MIFDKATADVARPISFARTIIIRIVTLLPKNLLGVQWEIPTKIV
jgi:hypothetical protein